MLELCAQHWYYWVPKLWKFTPWRGISWYAWSMAQQRHDNVSGAHCRLWYVEGSCQADRTKKDEDGCGCSRAYATHEKLTLRSYMSRLSVSDLAGRGPDKALGKVHQFLSGRSCRKLVLLGSPWSTPSSTDGRADGTSDFVPRLGAKLPLPRRLHVEVMENRPKLVKVFSLGEISR